MQHACITNGLFPRKGCAFCTALLRLESERASKDLRTHQEPKFESDVRDSRYRDYE